LKKRLTTVVIQALRPRAIAYYVADDQQVGLRVRVAPSGGMTWNLAYRIKGQPSAKGVSLGTCDPKGQNGMGIAEARERAAEVIKAARQGHDLLAEESDARQAATERLTVGELIDRYCRNITSPNRKGGALRTAREIANRLKRTLAKKLTVPADQLRRGDVSDLLDPVADGRPREAEKRRQVIGSMYRWGIAKGYVATDPTEGTESYGRGDPRDRVLAPDEIKAFWDWLDAGAQNMPPDVIAVLKVQLCLGARVGEVAGMDAAEVERDGERLLWTLPAARSKNKNDRTTPLVGTAREIVDVALERRPHGSLFRAARVDRPLQAYDVGLALQHRKLPCAPFTTHDLRRTAVSAMDEMGIALDTIAAVIGHQRGTRDTRTLVRHYSRPRLDERVEAALTAWNARLREIVDGRAGSANVVPIRREVPR
jgi:integrase